MTEEQITNRYVRGWISLTEFRAELVKFYDREDAKDNAARLNEPQPRVACVTADPHRASPQSSDALS